MDKERLKDYFYSNIAIIFWSSFLLLGGGIFVAYYVHIEYMPDFDLKSSIAITAAAAVTALIIISMLLAVMVMPGASWGNTWGGESSLKNYWTDDEGNRTLLGVLVWFAFPLASAFGTFVVATFNRWYAMIIFAVVISSFSLFLIFRRKLAFRLLVKEVFGLFGSAVISSVFMFLPLEMIWNLSFHESTSLRIPVWLAGILSVCCIIYINVLAAAVSKQKHEKPFYWYLGLGVLALYVVLNAFEKFDRIPVRIMELYKFGNIKATELVLKKEACQSLAALGVEVVEYGADICIAKDILILSRLGKEAYLEHDSQNHNMKFTVASDEIISWAISDVKGSERK
jgi:hypothetical protein